MTIVRVWLNSAACIVYVCVESACQGDHCQGVVELCSVHFVCVVSAGQGDHSGG